MRFRRSCQLSCARPGRPRRAFTLIEASLAIIIVGVGVLAAVELLATGTRANGDSHRLTTALNLAANVREMAQQQAADEVLGMNGVTLQPPRDARGQVIAGLNDWSQIVSVEKVSPGSITVSESSTSTSRLIRLTVTIRYRGKDLTTEMWLLADTSS